MCGHSIIAAELSNNTRKHRHIALISISEIATMSET